MLSEYSGFARQLQRQRGKGVKKGNAPIPYSGVLGPTPDLCVVEVEGT